MSVLHIALCMFPLSHSGLFHPSLLAVCFTSVLAGLVSFMQYYFLKLSGYALSPCLLPLIQNADDVSYYKALALASLIGDKGHKSEVKGCLTSHGENLDLY